MFCPCSAALDPGPTAVSLSRLQPTHRSRVAGSFFGQKSDIRTYRHLPHAENKFTSAIWSLRCPCVKCHRQRE
jgi:hypothetical protein